MSAPGQPGYDIRDHGFVPRSTAERMGRGEQYGEDGPIAGGPIGHWPPKHGGLKNIDDETSKRFDDLNEKKANKPFEPKPSDGGSARKVEVKDKEALRAAALRLDQAGEKITSLAGKANASEQISQGLPGTDTAKAGQALDDAVKGVFKAQGTWPSDIAGKVLDALSTITHQDERAAEQLKKLHPQDPGAPAPKGGGTPDDGKPKDDPKPTDGHDQPKPDGGDAPAPDPANAGADPRGSIPVGDVKYSGMGKFPGGKEACVKYINQALDARGITDPVARANWMKGMLTIAERESSFNSPSVATQVNQNDSNWASSTKLGPDGYRENCSRGGWQCIPSTFAANHQPGTSNDIYDPVASCAADMNHLMAAWGVSPDGHDLAQKVQQANPNKGPHGQ